MSANSRKERIEQQKRQFIGGILMAIPSFYVFFLITFFMPFGLGFYEFYLLLVLSSVLVILAGIAPVFTKPKASTQVQPEDS